MRRLLAAFCVTALVLSSASEADAGGAGDKKDTQVETDASSEGVSAGLNVWVAEGAVSLGSDPFAGCDTFVDLDSWELSSLTNTGVVETYSDGGGDVAVGVDADPVLFTLIRCDVRFVRFWQQGEAVPGDVINLLVLSARSRVPIVPPVPSVVPDGVDTPFLTQLPVWLWMTDDVWSAATASASLPGPGLTVSVTADPVATTWLPGDGSLPIVCEQGEAWRAGRADDETDCRHTFTATAGVGDAPSITMTTTVDYAVTVSCVPAALCANAPAETGPISISRDQEIVVTEVRGLLTQ